MSTDDIHAAPRISDAEPLERLETGDSDVDEARTLLQEALVDRVDDKTADAILASLRSWTGRMLRSSIPATELRRWHGLIKATSGRLRDSRDDALALACWPTWSGSASDSLRRARPIAAYDGARARTMAAFEAMPAGDPANIGPAILALVDAADPPLRLMLGEHALPFVRDRYEERLAEWERWSAVADGAQ